jgi:hypothetical protein
MSSFQFCFRWASGGAAVVLLALAAAAQELEWKRFLGSPDYDVSSSLAMDAEGDAYLGIQGGSPFYGGDIVYTNANRFALFVTKCRKDGAQLWTCQMEGQDLSGPYLACEPGGTLLACGSYSDSLTWSHGGSNVTLQARAQAPGWHPTDIFLLRLNSRDGQLLAANTLGGSDYQTCTAAAVGPGGDSFLAGGYRFWAEFGPILLNNQGGGYWVCRFSSNGTPVWAQSLTFTNSAALGPLLAVDRQSNVIVAGAFGQGLTAAGTNMAASGHSDLFIAKYSLDGDLKWIRRITGEPDKAAAALAVGADVSPLWYDGYSHPRRD